jgi:hypothetical protein
MSKVDKPGKIGPDCCREDLGLVVGGKNSESYQIDRGLVAMFLKLSPEERLRANDNAARTILELRNAYQQQKNNRCRSKRTT